LVVGGGTLAARGWRWPSAPSVTAGADAASNDDDSTAVAWCADGLQPISGAGCFAMPTGGKPRGEPAPLLLYLHGVYEQDHPSEELDRQRRVAARATRRGFAVLALRSGLGVCHPDSPDFATRFCWPSNEQVADRAGAFVDAWQLALGAAERRAGRGARYVLGFSSGGYFAALIAARSLFVADAFVIAHGGPVEPVRGRSGVPPLLLLSADDDVAQADMIRLDDELTREGWPHEHRACDGTHGLTDDDIDVALTFLARASHEVLPLHPPLAGHDPRWREREAGQEAGEDQPPATPLDGASPGPSREGVSGEAPPAEDAGAAGPGTGGLDAATTDAPSSGAIPVDASAETGESTADATATWDVDASQQDRDAADPASSESSDSR
jgi:predicted esterase